MSWNKIEEHLFEKYCVEGEDNEFCKLMEEHDKEIRDKVIEEFAKALLNNDVIDKSVVRRICEQMKVMKNEQTSEKQTNKNEK